MNIADFDQANALALHFLKEPLKITSDVGEPVTIEVLGLYLTEDLDKPQITKTLRGEKTSTEYFEWTITGVVSRSGGYMDPPDEDEFEVGKEFSLTKAIEKVILFFKEEEIKNFEEGYYWEKVLEKKSNDEEF